MTPATTGGGLLIRLVSTPAAARLPLPTDRLVGETESVAVIWAGSSA